MDEKDAHRLTDLTADLLMTFGRMKRSTHRAMPGDVHPGTEFGILDSILRHGCRTVPEIAAKRGVARQSIQAVVNKLVETGTIELSDNSDHKSSKLLNVTSRGTTFYDVVHQNLRGKYLKTNASLRDGDIEAAIRIMSLLAETWLPNAEVD